MGIGYSRTVKYPSNIDELEYTIEKIKQNVLNIPTRGKSTLPPSILEKAADHISDYLTKSDFTDCKILDVFSGNGVASTIIQKKMNVEMKSTDALDLSSYLDETSHPVEFNLTGVEAVKKYSSDNYNTLLMICPPPTSDKDSNYSDYFTIKEWSVVKSAKLFIFVGEMGASDGSQGLYHYMLDDNPYWKLEERKMLDMACDVFSGDIEKELFIFSARRLECQI